jgi:hypothetical protein
VNSGFYFYLFNDATSSSDNMASFDEFINESCSGKDMQARIVTICNAISCNSLGRTEENNQRHTRIASVTTEIRTPLEPAGSV